ncbi:type I pullulanase [Bacillus sp. CGMCC 1.16541]|uniref:type I pullulanase n=1 Tax=Bacillus sp. CGMCC 1.16541 TaxID=2185143 RepID=UPI0013A5A567|nr:type I pullulanase [Bacillus sp. CGMCC 1.16541]
MPYINRTFEAYLDKMDLITILIPKKYHEGKSNSFYLKGPEMTETLKVVQTILLDEHIKYECIVSSPLVVGQVYEIKEEHGATTDLQIGAVIRTHEFDEFFSYEGTDLGVTYCKGETTFCLWAPTATHVKVKTIDPETKRTFTNNMERIERGVWTFTEKRDIEGYYYTFLVCVNQIWREAIDPYTVALTPNSEYGVVVDINKTNISPTPKPPFQVATDAIIYEMHIRDFSIHESSGITQRGKYLGVVEEQTTRSEGEVTGFSYLKGLGVTHVELLPVNDFYGVDDLNQTESYNWGYNPLFFNVPEGSYAFDIHSPYGRINELKEMIRLLQKSGLRVILDVVYNHVYIKEESSFEKIVPGYFFRHDEFGMPSNGTGVGNDFASERKMARKFIVDSIEFWLKEYGVDGFRFDLMGILDIETMQCVRQKIHEIDPSVLLFGEGWDLNTPLPYEQKAIIHQAHQLPTIGYFNDRFRDSIKGSTFNLYDRGFIAGHHHKKEEVMQSIAGSVPYKKGAKYLFKEPHQSINYIESHDNHTTWDKLKRCNEHEQDDILQKRQRLGTAIVLLSQGIPFLHSGQEFYRTKDGVENSYRSSDHINALDWNRCAEYKEDVQYIKDLISLRKYHQAFRLPTTAQIREHLSFLHSNDCIVAYKLQNVSQFGPWRNIIVAFNNDLERQTLELHESGWYIAARDMKVDLNGYAYMEGDVIEVPPVSVLVLFQK